MRFQKPDSSPGPKARQPSDEDTIQNAAKMAIQAGKTCVNEEEQMNQTKGI